jgi:hypothetical protein
MLLVAQFHVNAITTKKTVKRVNGRKQPLEQLPAGADASSIVTSNGS